MQINQNLSPFSWSPVKKAIIMSVLLPFLAAFFSLSCKQAGDPGIVPVRNLKALARLYGYVRYFHPSDEAAGIDWDYFAIHAAGKVKEAKDREGLKAVLEDLFSPVAPTVRIYEEGKEPPLPKELQPADPSNLKVVAWQHSGLGFGSAASVYKSIRLNRKNIASMASGSGILTQVLDATPYAGREIRLTAAARTDFSDPAGRFQFWLRVDKKDNTPGFFDNMMDRPIRTPVWKECEIVGKVDEDAQRIVVGLLQIGEGKAWADAFRLETRSAGGDWESCPLQNAGFEEGTPEEPHKGWALTTPGFKAALSEENAWEGRKCLSLENQVAVLPGRLFDEAPGGGEVVRKPLGQGLFCLVPVALYSDEEGTIGGTDEMKLSALKDSIRALAESNPDATEVDLRLGDIIILWNVFQHFYPYFGDVQVDWEAVLDRYLRKAMQDRTVEDFFVTVSLLVEELKDGHGNVFHQIYAAQAGPPFGVELIEGRVVIMAAAEDSGLKKGDIILEIDGRDAGEIYKEGMDMVSGSPQWKRAKAAWRIGFGERGSKGSLKLEREGEIVEKEFIRNATSQFREERGANIHELEEGVIYVNLDQAEWMEIQKRIEEIAAARGVVFDLRGYPKGNHAVISHLLRENDTSKAWMRIPQIIYPDREGITYREMGWELPVKEPHIGGKVVFLTDGRAVSYAESFMSFIEHYKLGEIVGGPTAGANGNVNPFQIPGGFRIIYTGMRVVKHDGSPHHTVGIQPTVPVERTIEGIRAGRDAYIEKALELINR